MPPHSNGSGTTVSIVIPFHNEEAAFDRLRAELSAVCEPLALHRIVELVLVDDGSSDHTWPRLLDLRARGVSGALRIHLERHHRNLGLGAALRTGFSAATGGSIVTTDSDGTYRFGEIPALLDCLRPGVDIVTASPYHPDGAVAGVPAYRLVLSRGSSLIYRTLVSRDVHTYTALFRAYRADVVRSVAFHANGFLAVAELLVNAMLAGYRVAEYPTVLHSRVTGESKAKLVRTITAHLRFQSNVLRRRLSVAAREAPRTAS